MPRYRRRPDPFSCRWIRGWSEACGNASSGHCGIDDTNVDLNKFNGSTENLVKWISPAGAVPPIPPRPETASVKVDITAPENVLVDVSVHGSSVSAKKRRRRISIERGPDVRR
jgi:hypothetical protein